MIGGPVTSGSTVRSSRTNCCAPPPAPRCPPWGGSGSGIARSAPTNLRRSSSGTSASGDRPRVQVALERVELVDEVPVELGLEVRQRGLGDLALGVRQPADQRVGLVAELRGSRREARRRPPRRRGRSGAGASPRAWSRRSMSTGLERPMRTGATSGAKLLMISIFSACSSGIRRRTESTSDTEGSFSKASCFRPQLLERPGGGEAVEARAAGGGEDAPLPGHRLGALGLQVQQVVVEAHPRAAPRARRR